MADEMRPIRRVVTGNDEQGRSCVLFDSAAPNVNPGAISRGTCMTDIWVYKNAPACRFGTRDDGPAVSFRAAARRRTSADRAVDRQTRGLRPSQGPACKPLPTRLRPDGVWDRGGTNFFRSPVHKSATVDYGILLEGERTLLLDRGNVVMKPGDVVVQLGNWHGWCQSARAA